jgi:nucleoside-diphosphate-sugar epimerase
MTATEVAVPRRTVVTGASGLLGSNVVRTLLDGGGEVVAVVRDPGRAATLLPRSPDLHVVHGDVTDVPALVEAGVFAGAEALVHTAAYFREYYEPGADPALLHRTNVGAVGALLRAAESAGLSSAVHVSSVGVLGPSGPSRPATESTPLDRSVTQNHYYLSKIDSEQVVAEFRRSAPRMRVSTVLPGWMWGPGDAGPTSAGRLFLAIAEGRMPRVPAAGNHVVDARDVAQACVRAAVAGNGRYIVAGVKRPLPQVAAAAARAVGVAPPRRVPPRVALAVIGLMERRARRRGLPAAATRQGLVTLIEGHRRHIDSGRATAELGIGFRDLDDTMRATAAWYRDRGMVPA